MHRDHLRISSAAVLLTFALVSVQAQERRIDARALPPAVQLTLEQQTQGATIKGFSTEREHGKKVYEAETIKDGHTRDLQFAEDGTLTEVEEEIALTALPVKVQSALRSKAAAASITKVESLTKRGKLVAYEAATLRGSRKGEVQVGPTGETLAHAE